MHERVQCGVRYGISHVIIKLIIITILFQTDESIYVNNCVLDGSNISMDSNVLFKDDSLEVLSHRYSINNKEVSIFFKVIVK